MATTCIFPLERWANHDMVQLWPWGYSDIKLVTSCTMPQRLLWCDDPKEPIPKPCSQRKTNLKPAKKRSKAHVEKDMLAIHTQPKTKWLSGFTAETQRCSITVSPQYQMNLNCSNNRSRQKFKHSQIVNYACRNQDQEETKSNFLYL